MKCQINSQFKPDLPQHKPGSPWENWSLPTTTSQLHLVCTTLSLLRTILDPVACPKVVVSYAAAFAVEMCAHVDRIKHSLEEHLWHVASILASGKTRMAPKTNNSTTAWWLASKSTNMPLAMTMSNQQWWLPTTSLLHLFCTTSLLRTILDPARWWLDKKFDSWSTAWKSTCGTMAVQLQQSHPCEWQNQDSSQAKQNYHCMVAGIELERRATVHEMSNQQSEKQIFPNTNLDRPWGKLLATPTTSQLHLVCTAWSLLWWQCNFNSGTLASGKTRQI